MSTASSSPANPTHIKPLVAVTHGAPRVPGDAQDHDGDREADQRVGDRDADRDHRGAGDHGERDICVCAGVRAVGDQRGAVEPAAGAGADDRGDPVAGEADRAGCAERAELVDVLGVEEAVDRLVAGDACGDEDRGNDGEPGPPLGARGTQQERDPSGIAVAASPTL